MSVALLPQFGSEMDDSVMLEDHPADTTIAIDMESPKQNGNGVITQPMTFTSNLSAPQNHSFWPQPQPNPQNNINSDQIVDAEFDIELTNYEEDGMMSATEVEMSVPTYGDTYEYEMSYETGHVDPVYDTVDTDVRDAEVVDAAISHAAPVPDSTTSTLYTTDAPPSLPPAEYEAQIVDAPTEVAPVLHSYPADAETVAHSLDDTASTHGAMVPPVTSEAANETARDNEAYHGDTHPEGEPLNLDSKDVASTVSALEELSSTVIVDILSTVPENVESGDSAGQPAEAQEPTSTSTEDKAETNPPEFVVATYEETGVDSEDALAATVPPILLSMPSEAERPQRMLSLFRPPDLTNISSSSNSSPGLPTVLLENHHHLFVEPIANLLVQLRTELLQTQPEAISPTEFEYKELCIAARELQLILTEDNIYSREITLYDLTSMHQSCGLAGYLHLDVSLQPRFIDRYRAIRQAIENQDKGEPAELNNAREEEGQQHDQLAGDHQEPAKASEQHISKEDVQGVDEVNEENAEEPPLPADDDGNWSEEQNDGQEYLEDGAGSNWDDIDNTHAGDETSTNNHNDNGEDHAAEEEYEHEDDFVAVSGSIAAHDGVDGLADYDREEQNAEHEQQQGYDGNVDDPTDHTRDAGSHSSNTPKDATAATKHTDTSDSANTTENTAANSAREDREGGALNDADALPALPDEFDDEWDENEYDELNNFEGAEHLEGTTEGSAEWNGREAQDRDDTTEGDLPGDFNEDGPREDDFPEEENAEETAEEDVLEEGEEYQEPQEIYQIQPKQDVDTVHQHRPASQISQNSSTISPYKERASSPLRKRSFSEVEAEPEDERSASPGSKRARHA